MAFPSNDNRVATLLDELEHFAQWQLCPCTADLRKRVRRGDDVPLSEYNKARDEQKGLWTHNEKLTVMHFKLPGGYVFSVSEKNNQLETAMLRDGKLVYDSELAYDDLHTYGNDVNAVLKEYERVKAHLSRN